MFLSRDDYELLVRAHDREAKYSFEELVKVRRILGLSDCPQEAENPTTWVSAEIERQNLVIDRAFAQIKDLIEARDFIGLGGILIEYTCANKSMFIVENFIGIAQTLSKKLRT